MKTLVFISGCGHENQEFWDLLERLRKEGKCLGSRWSGDFYISEFVLDGKNYTYEEDMELGIPYKITIKDEEDK